MCHTQKALFISPVEILHSKVLKIFIFFIAFLCDFCRLYEVVETYTRIHLITEYAYSGELYTRVTLQGRMTEEEAKPLFAQMVSAINYMVNNSTTLKKREI